MYGDALEGVEKVLLQRIGFEASICEQAIKDQMG